MSNSDLTCSICYERYCTPKALPCQHTFCLNCLQNLIKHRSESGNIIKCPKCRRGHRIPPNGETEFCTNSTVAEVLKDATSQETIPKAIYHNQERKDNESYHQPRPLTNSTGDNVQQNLESSAVGSAEATKANVITENSQEPKQEDIDMELAIQIAITETAGRRQEENIENGGDASEITEPEPSCRIECITKVRDLKQSVVHAILANFKKSSRAFVMIFLLVTFGRFVAGASKLSSDCHVERQAAVYLFVKACPAILFWGALAIWMFKPSVEDIVKNAIIETYLFIDSVFSFGWLVVGTVWIFGNFTRIYSDCHKNDINWNGHFINFALFLTVVDCIGVVVFILFTGYTLSDSTD